MDSRHKEGCEFEKKMEFVKDNYWTQGEGETAGSVSAWGNESISFGDGFDGVTIEFKYCPECGAQLRQT